jgi:hypothetical protein
MTLDEARAHVINRFIYIEERVDDLIAKEIEAREDRKSFVREILLNTAIIPTSNKFKLIRHLIALNGWPTVNETHFHRLLQIRNQFAHVRGQVHLTANVIMEEGKVVRVDGEQLLKLESLDGRGLLKKVEYRDALSEFDEHYAELRRVLHAIRDQLAEQDAPSNGG